MKKRAYLCVEQLESRDTPSGTPAVCATGVFLPPGLNRVVEHPNLLPAVQVSPTGAIAFLPPGLDRTVEDPNEVPPPVRVVDGSLVFVPPGPCRTTPPGQG